MENLRLAVIKKVKGKTKQPQEVEEQKIIFKFDCVNKGLNRDYLFVSLYVMFISIHIKVIYDFYFYFFFYFI